MISRKNDNEPDENLKSPRVSPQHKKEVTPEKSLKIETMQGERKVSFFEQ